MTAYTDAVLADSPVVFWQMSEASGTVVTDSSGNGNDGTYYGTLDHQGRELWSGMDVMEFVAGTYAELDSPIALSSPYTIEAWAIREPSTITGYDKTVVAGDTPFTGYYTGLYQIVSDAWDPADGWLPVNADAPYTIVGSSSLWPSYTQPAQDGAYNPKTVHHYVLAVGGVSGSADYYIDGELVDSYDSDETPINWANFTLRCGKEPISGDGDWIGGIGNVAVYDTKLSAERVFAHYIARPHDWTDTDSSTASDSAAGDLEFVTSDSAAATDADGELVVILTDTDSATATEGTSVLGLFAVESIVANDRFTGGRVDPNIAVTDLFTLTDSASMTSDAAGAWTPDAPYDATIRYPIFDFRDPVVTSLPDAEESMFDVDIAYPIFDFTVPDWADAHA